MPSNIPPSRHPAEKEFIPSQAEPESTDDAGSAEEPEDVADAPDKETLVQMAIDAEISMEDAAKQLGISAKQFRIFTLHATSPSHRPDVPKPIEDEAVGRFSDNWEQALDGAEITQEPLPPIEQVIQSAPVRWFLGTERRRMATALIACSVLGAGVYYLAIREPNPEPVVPVAGDTEQASSNLPTEAQRDLAEKVARAYLAADSWEEKLELVWDPEKTRELMVDWYETQGQPLETEQQPSLHLAAASVRKGVRYVILSLHHDDGTKTNLPVRVGDGPDETKVLWQAAANYQPMDWHEFADKRPAAAMDFRVSVKSIPAPEQSEGAESEFLLFELSPPLLNPVPIRGVVRKSSEVAAALEVLTEFGEGTGNAILKLQFTDRTPAQDIVEIKSVESDHWLN